MVQRVIVTGATGTIGRAVVSALLGRQREVVVFSRDPARARQQLPDATDHVRYVQGVEGDWVRALKDATAVVNLAGESLFRPLTGRRHRRRVTEDRIQGVRVLLRAIAKTSNGPRVFIGASSIGVYGFENPDDLTIDEDWVAAPQDDTAMRSREWESAALDGPDGVRVVLLRMGFVLSHLGGGLPYQLEQARKGKVGYFSPGSQWLPWVHVDDVVGVIVAALEDSSWSGPYNVVSPTPVRSKDFAACLATLTGAQVRRTPRWVARVFMGAGADTVLRGRRIVPAKLVAAHFAFEHSTLDSALRHALDGSTNERKTS